MKKLRNRFRWWFKCFVGHHDLFTLSVLLNDEPWHIQSCFRCRTLRSIQPVKFPDKITKP